MTRLKTILSFMVLMFLSSVVNAEIYYDGELESAYPERNDTDFYSADEPTRSLAGCENGNCDDRDFDASPTAVRNAPLPLAIHSSGEKIIMVDPANHAYGAYNAQGKLIRWGLATAGADWCDDINRPCRTKSGTFRIYSLGNEDCISRKFPIPEGGAPMPYCMYFNGGQALHGSDNVVYDNISHGCVRVHVSEARWLRYHFIEGPGPANHYRGTKIVITAY